MSDFKQIDDHRIFHIWKDEDSNYEVSVHPDFYQDNGTPISAETADDMVYHHTEIDLEGFVEIEPLLKQFTPTDMFYTPEDKEAATKFLENHGGAQTVGFMVGYNYACAMLRKVVTPPPVDVCPSCGSEPDAQVYEGERQMDYCANCNQTFTKE